LATPNALDGSHSDSRPGKYGMGVAPPRSTSPSTSDFMNAGKTARLPVGCTVTPRPRDQVTRAACSARSSRRSRLNARTPIPADRRW
jgi:hypothetical protein